MSISGDARHHRRKDKQTRQVAGLYCFGGAEEDRTPDLRIANATLSHLSYRPVKDA